MGTRRRTRVLAAVLAAATLITGCGQESAQPPTSATTTPPSPSEEATPQDPPPAPAAPDSDEPSPAGDETPPPPDDVARGGDTGATSVRVWFTRQSDTAVWLEPETLRLDDSTVQVLRAAVEAVVGGQSVNPELTSLVPPGTAVLDVAIADGVARIDLSEEIARAAGSSADEAAFAQQLAQTATQFDSVDAVRLLVEGEPIDELWGHVDWSEPITADPQAVSPIVVESPAWGATQPPGPVTASGTSVTFESTVELRLVDPDGTVVEETFTTAAQPDIGQRGPWTHTFDTDATTPGTWAIEAIEPDPSDGEGRPPFETSVEFVVS